MKITKNQLRRIIKESIIISSKSGSYSMDGLLAEGLFSKVGNWIKNKFGAVDVPKNPSKARLAVDEAIHAWIMSLIKDSMAQEKISEEEAREKAIKDVLSVFNNDHGTSPLAVWKKG